MAVTDLPESPSTDRTRPGRGPLAVGDKVEVRRRLDDQWARGFQVTAVEASGYRLRRLSDGVELPVPIAADDVRRERKRDFWWY